MATEQQIEANRANAQNSTGPRTEEGKARASMNALKSGIYAKSTVIRGENPDALDEIAVRFDQHWQPASPQERVQLDVLIRCAWRGCRYDRAESQFWNFTIDDFWKPDSVTPLGKAFSQRAMVFQRLDRLIDTNERRFRQATAELERLQSERRAAEAEKAAEAPAAEATPLPELASAPQPPQSETTSSGIGFVPQSGIPSPVPRLPEVASAPKTAFRPPGFEISPATKGGRR